MIRVLRRLSTLALVFYCGHSLALDIQQWTTQNGVEVLFVEAHELPMVDVRLNFRAGSALDGQQRGISRLVNALLVEGTGDYSAQQIAREFESTGAQLGHNSLRDMAWVSLRSLSDPALRARTVDLFARVSALPSFPTDAIERDRRALLLSLAERKKAIGSVVEDTFMQNVYRGHAYAIGPGGSEAGLEGISRDDLVAFHRRYYVGRNANLAIVGDLTASQARQYAEQLTRYLEPGEPAAAVADITRSSAAGQTIRVDFDATQTHIKLGMPVLRRQDPDFFALYIGNHVLGGSGFSSRLVQEIRENRGLVYSVYSYFLPMAGKGPFQMSLQTANDQAQQALGLLDELLADFIANGPTAQELEHAQSNITGSFPLKIDSNNKVVEYLALIGFYDLPLDYLDSFNQRVLEVTAQQIRDAFKRRVDPDSMTRVIVGGAS